MAKYITFVRLTALGAKGLLKESAAVREAAVRKAVEASGGKVEAIYWTNGKYNFVMISDGGAEAGALMIQLAVQAAGVADDFDTLPLFSSDAVDAAIGQATSYRPPRV
jgi:uncharacterized protein with GYD domain